MVLRKIYFSKERLAALKDEASRAASGTPDTSAVSVSAHLWRALTRARELPGDSSTHFSLTVDGRQGINLPESYFGNALRWATAQCTVGALLERPLSSAASLSHESIELSRSVEAYQWLIDAIEIHGPQNVRFAHQSCFGQDVGATFWTQMHLYELDFGWGAPVHGGRNVPPIKALDGFFAVLPCSPQISEPGSVLVLAYLNTEVADRLLSTNPDLTFNPSPRIEVL
jgi:shikimate O-hydroxycinnamoyltransferase